MEKEEKGIKICTIVSWRSMIGSGIACLGDRRDQRIAERRVAQLFRESVPRARRLYFNASSAISSLYFRRAPSLELRSAGSRRFYARVGKRRKGKL
jgi:hypothetical protein